MMRYGNCQRMKIFLLASNGKVLVRDRERYMQGEDNLDSVLSSIKEDDPKYNYFCLQFDSFHLKR